MYHDGSVLSPTLHFVHLLHHSDNGLWSGALTIWAPVLNVELSYLMRLARLHVWIRRCSESNKVASILKSNSVLLRIAKKWFPIVLTNLVYGNRQSSLHIATKLLLWHQLNTQVTIVHITSAWPVLVTYWLWVQCIMHKQFCTACSFKLPTTCFTYLSILL